MSLVVLLCAASVALGQGAKTPTEVRVEPGPDALAKAQAEVRRRIAAGEAVTVTLADGIYRLAEPLVFGKDDSGSAARPVVWKAAHRGQAVVTGQADIREVAIDWTKAPASLIPEASRPHVRCWEIGGSWEIPGFYNGGSCRRPDLHDLAVGVFSDGERATIARWPNGAFARTGEPIGEISTATNAVRSKKPRIHSGVFKLKDAPLARWAKEPDLWAYGMYGYEWSDISSPVLKADPEKGTLSVEPSKNPYGFLPRMPFYVFNSFSDLDAEGEWAIDRKARRVYLWQRETAAGTPRPREPIVAGATGLVTGKGVRSVSFEGLVFEVVRGTAIQFEGAEAVTVRSSCVRRTGGSGILFGKAKDCRVEGCDLYDLGEMGIRLDGGDRPTLTPGNNVADNCHIHHYGRISPNYNAGVVLWGCGNRATHNLIHHSPHNAISFDGNDHTIGFNVCHDCCSFTDDAGAIYCCQRDWTKRGTVIEYNLIHMTGKQPRARHVRGIYLDDWSCGTIVRGNIVNRAPQCIYLGGGNDNLVVGNVLVNGPESAADIGTRGLDSFAKKETARGAASGIYRNYAKSRKMWDTPLWRARYPRLAELEKLPTPIDAHNANFNVVTGNVCAATAGVTYMNWPAIAARTVITNNFETAGDPGFVDYYGFNWELKENAPARKTLGGGTRFGEMGLYASPLRFSPPVKHGEEMTAPRPFGLEKIAPLVYLYVELDNKAVALIDKIPVGAEWTEQEVSFVPDRTGLARFRLRGRPTCEPVEFADFRIDGELMTGVDVKHAIEKGKPVEVKFRLRMRLNAGNARLAKGGAFPVVQFVCAVLPISPRIPLR